MFFAMLAVLYISRINTESIADYLLCQITDLEDMIKKKEIYHASMIHELRGPLSAAVSGTDLLSLSRNLSQEDSLSLAIIKQCNDIVLNLINNALDMAKLEAGKVELDFQFTHV